MEKNKPVKVLWDGNIKAAIFANAGQNGPIYSTSYARIYTDKQGQLKEAYSFSGVENLRLSELSRRVHHATNNLRAEYNKRSATAASAQAPQQEQMPVETPQQTSTTPQTAYDGPEYLAG